MNIRKFIAAAVAAASLTLAVHPITYSAPEYAAAAVETSADNPIKTYAEFEGYSLEFTLYSDHASVSAFGCIDEYISVTIPDSINGLPITEISDGTFMNSDKLLGVTLPSGLVSIGASAFEGCHNMGDVDFPEGLKSIGDNAFKQCFSMSGLWLPDSLESIGSDVFENTNWLDEKLAFSDTKLIIHNGVVISGSGCRGAVTIPEGTRLIAGSAFLKSTASSVNIPGTVTYIGDKAFAYSHIKELVLPENTIYAGDMLFAKYGSSDANVTVLNPDCVLTGSFDDKTAENESSWYLYTGTVTGYSGSTAEKFAADNGYEFISLDDAPFSRYYDVQDGFVTYRVYSDHAEVISNLSQEDYTNVPSLNILPEVGGQPVTAIADKAFYEAGYSEIIIPDTVTSIGSDAFVWCYELKSIVLPESITSVGTGLFTDCVTLERVELPSGIPVISEDMFTDCGSLKEVLIYSCDCGIYDSASTIPQGTVYGYTGSTAEAYAANYGREFIPLDAPATTTAESTAVTTTTAESTAVTTTTTKATAATTSTTKATAATTSTTKATAATTSTTKATAAATTTTKATAAATSTTKATAAATSTTIAAAAGDINGDGKFKISDAVLLAKYLVGEEALSKEQRECADLNNDGSTDVFDFVLLRRLLIEELI